MLRYLQTLPQTLLKHYINTTILVQNKDYSLGRETQVGMAEHLVLVVVQKFSREF